MLLSFLDTGTTVEYIVISLIILGFGFAMFSSPNANAAFMVFAAFCFIGIFASLARGKVR